MNPQPGYDLLRRKRPARRIAPLLPRQPCAPTRQVAVQPSFRLAAEPFDTAAFPGVADAGLAALDADAVDVYLRLMELAAAEKDWDAVQVPVMLCFAIYMLGTGYIAAKIDDFIPGLGSILYEVVGLTGHYTAFIRGVIEMADIIYFVAWTILFLVLNILYIDGRSRKGAKLIFTTSTAIALGIGLMGNWLISDISLGRFDVTEDKIFTVSDASVNILSTIDTPVQIKLYMTPKGIATPISKGLWTRRNILLSAI